MNMVVSRWETAEAPMADPNQQTIQAGSSNAVGPSAAHATRFGLYHTAADFAISFASLRMVIDAGTGSPSAAALEWFATISMSPTLAEQLCIALGVTIADYKKQFGEIPKDPLFKLEQTKEKTGS